MEQKVSPKGIGDTLPGQLQALIRRWLGQLLF